MSLSHERHAQLLLYKLSRHIGAKNGIGVECLAQYIYGADATEREQRAVRRMVEELRRDGEHICADPGHGYYIAKTEEELDTTCRFLYSRAMTSLTQIAAMKRVSLPDLAGQLRIRMEEKA